MSRVSFKTFSILCCLLGVVYWAWAQWLSPQSSPHDSQRVLKIYNWAHYLPDSLIADFEKEYGVKVIYDVFETSETLEAKLSAGSSGYDVVFPSAWPGGAQLLAAGVFLPLDLTKIPNFSQLDPLILKRLREIDATNQHLIPYLWGTTGIAYNVDCVQKLAPGAPVNSWALLFDPKWAKRLARGHIALLDSPVDVFSSLFCYIGKPQNDLSTQALEQAGAVLSAVRPWVSKFESSQTIQDLLTGQVCAAQVFSSYGNMAVHEARLTPGGPNIRYVIPQEGAVLWIDTMAIPRDAPNPFLAYLFIDYCLRPPIAALLTQRLRTANAVPNSRVYLPKDVLDDPGIYPPQNVFERLVVEYTPPQAYRKRRLRLWTSVRTGH